MAYPERGRNLLQRVIEQLADIASPENMMRQEGRTVTVTLLPKPANQQKRAAAASSGQPENAGGGGISSS
jgi:hypothetical protein